VVSDNFHIERTVLRLTNISGLWTALQTLHLADCSAHQHSDSQTVEDILPTI